VEFQLTAEEMKNRGEGAEPIHYNKPKINPVAKVELCSGRLRWIHRSLQGEGGG